MAAASLRDHYVAKLFLAYFERAPEYQALVYYQAALDATLTVYRNAGQDDAAAYRQFSSMLYATGAANAEIPAAVITDDAGFVSYIYHTILGRGADAGGHAYWLAALADGASRAEVVDAFLMAAEGDARDAAYVGNRVDVALAFAAWQNSNPAILADLPFNAAEVLQGVNEDPASVLQAEDRLYDHQPHPPVPPEPPSPPSPPVPKYFLLTPQADDFAGTRADDVFVAPVRHDGKGLAATLQSIDRLDGGAGDDLLEADLYGAEAAPAMARIETLRLYNSANAQDAVLDLADSDGQRDLEFLASAGGVLVRNAGTIERIAVHGAQASTLAVQGIAAQELAIDVQGVAGSPGGWAELWLGDEDSTFALDGPYVLGLARLELTVMDNADGFLLRNTTAEVFNLHTEGDTRVRVEGNASEELHITGSGKLELTMTTMFGLDGTFLFNGEYARVLDTSGFDGQISTIWIYNCDDDNFRNATITLGDGRHTVGFDTTIAEGVQIHGGSRADSWTTLELMQNAYDSLAGFQAGSVTNVDELRLIGASEGGDYALLHGAVAFDFAWGIEAGATATLDVGATQPAWVGLGGNMKSGEVGELVIQSDDVLAELEIRLGNWESNSLIEAGATIEAAAQTLVIDAGQSRDPLGGEGGGETVYNLILRDGALDDLPDGAIESIVITGDQWVVLDLSASNLGASLQSVDASGNGGGLDLTLTGHQGIEVTASQYLDTFIIGTSDTLPTALNTLIDVTAGQDFILLQLEGTFAAGAAFDELIIAGTPDDLDAALELAYAQLDASTGGQAGWFTYDDMTYVIAKEESGATTQYAALEIQAAGIGFGGGISDNTAEIWIV